MIRIYTTHLDHIKILLPGSLQKKSGGGEPAGTAIRTEAGVRRFGYYITVLAGGSEKIKTSATEPH